MSAVTLKIVTAKNRQAGSIELDPAVFSVPIKPYLLHAEVRRQLARRRRGTHSTKNRAAVSGGGVKPWRQKGTRRARQGSIRSPQWAGGGVVFGPVPRDYSHALPKKVRRAALCSALSLRAGEGAVTVVKELEIDEYKTKQVLELLSALKLSEASVLIVIEDANPYVERSARNLPGIGVVRAAGVNVYDVLRHDKLLLTRAAAETLCKRLGA